MANQFSFASAVYSQPNGVVVSVVWPRSGRSDEVPVSREADPNLNRTHSSRCSSGSARPPRFSSEFARLVLILQILNSYKFRDCEGEFTNIDFLVILPNAEIQATVLPCPWAFSPCANTEWLAHCQGTIVIRHPPVGSEVSLPSFRSSSVSGDGHSIQLF